MAEKRRTIGLIGIADFRSVIGQDLIRGVVAAAGKYNVDCINCCGSTNHSFVDDQALFDRYRSYFRFMNRRNIDGLLTWASSFTQFMEEPEIIAAHRSLGRMPMVALGLPVLPGVPGVFTDDEYDMSLMMDHLVNVRKFRRIGFLGALNRPQYVRRLEFYRKWLASHGMPVDESLVFLSDRYDRKDVVELTDRILREGAHRPPLSMEALVTVSDIVAGYIINEFESHGVRVPEDIAVTGWNNQFESMTASVPITTIDLCFFERGYRAVELLLEWMDAGRNPAVPHTVESVWYPSRLVVRQSCGGFEPAIDEAGNPPSPGAFPGIESGVPVGMRRSLLDRLETFHAALRPDEREAISSAFISDWAGSTLHEFLTVLRRLVRGGTDGYVHMAREWNDVLSSIRAAVLPFSGGGADHERSRQMENILHGARVMLSLFDSYYIDSLRHEAYEVSNMGRLAVDLACASDIPEILRKTGLHAEELSIGSVCLVLQEEMTPSPEDGRLSPAFPSCESDPSGGRRFFVPKGNLPLNQIFGKHPSTVVLKLLFHRGCHIGYAVFGMGPLNIAVYDMFQSILSHALYAAFVRRNGIRTSNDVQLLLRTKKVRSILKRTTEQAGASGGMNANRSLNVGAIFEYLLNHLGDPTDLDRIAGDLGISKSHLMRRTKELTGYTIRTLHETLKMERAVLLLERNGSAGIAEIAERLGFRNQSYFARVFRKYKGLPPLAWKKRR